MKKGYIFAPCGTQAGRFWVRWKNNQFPDRTFPLNAQIHKTAGGGEREMNKYLEGGRGRSLGKQRQRMSDPCSHGDGNASGKIIAQLPD